MSLLPEPQLLPQSREGPALGLCFQHTREGSVGWEHREGPGKLLGVNVFGVIARALAGTLGGEAEPGFTIRSSSALDRSLSTCVRHQPEPRGEEGRLSAVVEVQLGVDVAHVVVHGAHAQDEAFGDLAVGRA